MLAFMKTYELFVEKYSVWQQINYIFHNVSHNITQEHSYSLADLQMT